MNELENYELDEGFVSIDKLYLTLTNNKRVLHLADHAKKRRTRKKNTNRIIDCVFSKHIQKDNRRTDYEREGEDSTIIV